jgi:hypothetical protein
MNTWNYRVNAIFTLLSTTMFILLGLNAATRPFLHQDPVLDIKLNQLLALYECIHSHSSFLKESSLMCVCVCVTTDTLCCSLFV